MAVINRIAAFEADATAWRRRLHEMPELDFDLYETAAFVAERLREIGVDEMHEGIARTGIVALIRGRAPGPVVGLRADMDALPIAEAVDRPWKSRNPGVMHACGHDGHTTILLTAARYLAETRNFAGTVALIFQPSEELSGGARVMVEEGIMERFGVSRVFGLHNSPGVELGRIETRPGAIMAAADQFDITLTGRGGHAAHPHDCVDPVAAALSLGQALLAIPARRVDPIRSGVLSLTVIHAGDATNVVPATARLAGTVRTLDAAERELIADAVASATSAIGAAFGVEAKLDYEFGYPVTRNDPDEAAFAARVAREVVGAANVDADRRPEMGSEDFSYMLEARPGAYVFVGAGPGAGLHHPAYDYNDAVTPIAASFLARLVETALPIEG
ncbi:M20 aminoacylase family protein [Amaricoccus sp.]|uniref:M20 aminoacylase family protein n=1 Tax=Amaricoccus sp. TaxID=1872485 RepID=UPI001B60A5CA|nr:M20 aminoacylase family protein [Amaricoccus sp.]MBP7240413.1 amidohydrolase [Amaricoccus sp.]